MQQMSMAVTCSIHHVATVGWWIAMSGREIAKLIDSRHSNVCVTIKRLMNPGAIGGYAALQYAHPQSGQAYHHYEVNKRDSYIIVAQLSPKLIARLVDHWQELESNDGMVVPRSLPEALHLAVDLAEQKQRLSEELAIAAPKVEFVDRCMTATGSMTFRQVAKLLSAKEPEFAMFPIENDIVYRLNRVPTPKSKYVEAGHFKMKTGTINQTNCAFSQLRFTTKGVRWIDGLWVEHITKGQTARGHY